MSITKLDPDDPDLHTCGTYVIIDENNTKAYVGSASDLFKRSTAHCTELKNNIHHNKPLQDAYNAGVNFEFITVATKTREEAYELEQSIINEYGNTNLLFNIGLDVKSGMKGRTHSNEARQKLKEANTGKILSDEVKSKISSSTKGIAKSQEFVEALRLRNIGRIVSEETKEKLRKHNLGKKHSAETKEKMSQKSRENADKNRDRQLNKISVEINGITYPSLTLASKSTGIPFTTLRRKMNK